jgi:hypothetical protein
MHDWTLVEAGIFHAFHHEWISEIFRALNRGLLPEGYYALSEQVAVGFGPDVLTLQDRRTEKDDEGGEGSVATATKLQTRPQTTFTAESEAEFYRRKKSAVAVRHVSGDRLVAIVEIVSPGNKASRNAFRAFVDKAWEFLESAFTCYSSIHSRRDRAIRTASMQRSGRKSRMTRSSCPRTSH